MTGYGAVSTKNPDDENSFEEYGDQTLDLRYVPVRTLTTQEKVRKWVSAGVPIVVAILLMVGFGWWTTNALTPRHPAGVVDHTEVPAQSLTVGPFPTPHPTTAASPTIGRDDAHTKATAAAPKVTPSATGSDESTSKPKKTRSSGSSACADNPECNKLGLVGDCCPTADGVQLGCCL